MIARNTLLKNEKRDRKRQCLYTLSPLITLYVTLYRFEPGLRHGKSRA